MSGSRTVTVSSLESTWCPIQLISNDQHQNNLTNSHTGNMADNSTCDPDQNGHKLQESTKSESSDLEVDGESSNSLQILPPPSLSDLDNTVEADVEVVSSSSSSVSTLSSTLSAMSLSSMDNSAIDNREEVHPSLGSSNSISTMSQTDDNDLKSRKQDFVIMNHEVDEGKVIQFMADLKSEDMGITDLTVEMFSQLGIGHQELSVLGDLPDQFNFILIYITNSVEQDQRQQFYSHILIDMGLDNNSSNKVIPVWTYKHAKDECKNKILQRIRGIQYWRRTENENPKLYIQCVQKLVKEGRKCQA